MNASFQYVIDTNIAIKQFIDDPLTGKVTQLFDHLEHNEFAQFYVPDLFYIECANVFLKYVRANQYPAEQVEEDLADLKALNLTTTPTKSLILPAIQISIEYGITAYDACYVALAHRVRAPLLTLDKRLCKALTSGPFDVHLFTEFVIPPLPTD